MKIHSMQVEHYRCFEQFDISFDSQLTVLIGKNGAGKTSVLDVLSIPLQCAAHPKNGLMYPWKLPLLVN